MLVDSHCHLDFPDFGGELDAIVAARAAAGIGRIVTISTRIKRHGDVLAIAERFADVFCSVGTHPHHAHEELDITVDDIVRTHAPSQGGGDRRGGPRLPLRLQPARRAGAGLPQSHRGCARRPACRWSSIRARPTTTWRASWRRRRGRGPSRPCCIASPAAASWRERAIALGLSISFTGIVTFKKSDELRAIAASLPADRILVETDAPYLAPGRHRGKRNEPAFVVETAKVLAETRGVSFEEIARQTTDNFFRLFTKVPRPRPWPPALRSTHPDVRYACVKFTILGCGSSGGVPRPALGWGDCDPNNPKNRRRRTSLLVERRASRASPASWSTPRRTCASSCSTPRSTGSTRSSTPTSTPTTPTASTTCAACSSTAASACRSISTSAPRRSMHQRFGYCFAAPPGSEYPPIVRENRMAAGEPVTVEGQGARITALPILQEHGDITSLGFRFGGLAYSCDLKRPAAESVAALAGLDVWIIDALRYKPHPSHLSVDEALALIERLRPRRAILTNLHTDLDYEELRERLPPHVEPAFDGLRIELADDAMAS